MKGMIFNQLEDMLTETAGSDAWDEVVSRATLQTADGAYAGPKVYPDSDLMSLVESASGYTKIPIPDLVRAFGRYMFPRLARRFPQFLKSGMSAKSFLVSVDRVIHVEVKKLHQDAELPHFSYQDDRPNEMTMVYRSPRKLCDLAAGLIDGVGAHFGETIDQQHVECTKRGADACRFRLRFTGNDVTAG